MFTVETSHKSVKILHEATIKLFNGNMALIHVKYCVINTPT